MACLSASAASCFISLQEARLQTLSSELAMQPGPLCAQRSSCEGEGLSRAQAGELTAFKIVTCDGFGNRQTAGGDDIRAQVSCAEGGQQSSVTASVTDVGKGVYKVRAASLPKPRQHLLEQRCTRNSLGHARRSGLTVRCCSRSLSEGG